jgi:hypothetical protein
VLIWHGARAWHYNTGMRFRLLFATCLLFAFASSTALSVSLRAQDDDNGKPEQHGRKYKAPPDTSHIEVTVIKGFNKKPIDGAHVVFSPSKNGVDEGSLELKTHPDGKAIIDVIPTGSKVRIQVIADGFATYAEDYVVNEPSRAITIAMIRPRAQISTYLDNEGKPSQMQPGVQEPIRPKPSASGSSPSTPGTTGSASPSGNSSTPAPPPPQP